MRDCHHNQYSVHTVSKCWWPVNPNDPFEMELSIKRWHFCSILLWYLVCSKLNITAPISSFTYKQPLNCTHRLHIYCNESEHFSFSLSPEKCIRIVYLCVCISYIHFCTTSNDTAYLCVFTIYSAWFNLSFFPHKLVFKHAIIFLVTRSCLRRLTIDLLYIPRVIVAMFVGQMRIKNVIQHGRIWLMLLLTRCIIVGHCRWWWRFNYRTWVQLISWDGGGISLQRICCVYSDSSNIVRYSSFIRELHQVIWWYWYYGCHCFINQINGHTITLF